MCDLQNWHGLYRQVLDHIISDCAPIGQGLSTLFNILMYPGVNQIDECVRVGSERSTILGKHAKLLSFTKASLKIVQILPFHMADTG